MVAFQAGAAAAAKIVGRLDGMCTRSNIPGEPPSAREKTGMTTYSFKPNANTQDVNWDDPTIWAGGVVPNAPDADVDFPTVTRTGTGEIYTSFVNILAGESFAVRSVALRDYLTIAGSLTVDGQLTAHEVSEINMTGGTLSAGSIVNDGYGIQGPGHITVGTLTNNTLIQGNGNLTITANAFVNNGTIAASQGTTTIDVGAGGFANFSGGTLMPRLITS